MLDGQPTWQGFPIALTSLLPNVATDLAGKIGILFGDMGLAVTLVDRRRLTIRRSDDRFFESDQVGFFRSSRIDIACNDLGDSASAGPLVGLQLTA